MKKKLKKLSLSTETVRHLTEPNLKEAAGGTTSETRRCTLCTAACSVCCP
jgi:hypothetical protein